MLASICLSFSYGQQWQDSRTVQQLAKKNDNDTSLKNEIVADSCSDSLYNDIIV